MCDAELILELPTASLAEVMPTNKAGEASVVVRVTPSGNENSSAINIISIIPTEAQVVETQTEIGVKPHQVQSSQGAPLLFILAGDYKIPLRSEVPCINISENTIPGITKAYQFDVLGLQLQIQFPQNTPRLVMQHFEEVLIQQSCLKVNGQQAEANSVYTGPSQSAMQSMLATQPQWDMPAPDQKHNSSTTDAILSGVNTVGGGVASGLRTGALLLSSAITSGAMFIVSHTDKTTDPVAVPGSWTSGVKTARMTSKGAVTVTAGVAKSLIGVTSIVSDVISNKLRTVIKNDDKKDDPDSETVRSLKLVGIATADQAISLYEAATDSARTILTATCAGICQVVDHKLGQEAGNFAQDGLGLVEDAYDASKAVGSVGAKGILKETIKITAVKTLKEDP